MGVQSLPPADDVMSATDSDDVIARVTEATCLVEVTGPADGSTGTGVTV